VLHGVYQNELKACVHTEICTWIFLAALFTFTKTWKQPRCSGDEWINNSIQAVEYYSALKINQYQAMKTHGGTLNAK
jgi:hypothetical protein